MRQDDDGMFIPAPPRRGGGFCTIRRMIRIACIALLCLPVPLALGDTAPMRVTTDTAAYCQALARDADRTTSPPAEARRLEIEGEAMCDHGQVVAGIRRLRQALAVIRAHHKHP